MADQLAGQWYAVACGLPSIVPPKNAKSSLSTILQYLLMWKYSINNNGYKLKKMRYNVKKFGTGDMGAANGMKPNGRADTTCLQSSEVWTGTSYACMYSPFRVKLALIQFMFSGSNHVTRGYAR